MSEYFNAFWGWLFAQQYSISPLGLLGALSIGSWLRGRSDRRRVVPAESFTARRSHPGGQVQPIRSVSAPLPTKAAHEDDE